MKKFSGKSRTGSSRAASGTTCKAPQAFAEAVVDVAEG
jgi:hypothetical protein